MISEYKNRMLNTRPLTKNIIIIRPMVYRPRNMIFPMKFRAFLHFFSLPFFNDQLIIISIFDSYSILCRPAFKSDQINILQGRTNIFLK